MFRKIIIALVIISAMPVAALAQKFGVVDTQAILAAMPEFTTLNSDIETLARKHDEELKNLKDRYNKEYSDLQALPADTPASIRDRRISELQEQDQKIQQYMLMAQEDMRNQRESRMAPIIQKVTEAIYEVGTEGGFAFIDDKTQHSFVGIMVEDVTPQVKARLGL